MKFKLTVLIALLVIQCFTAILTDKNTSYVRQPRIIDGTIAQPGQYPYIAKIFWYWSQPNVPSVGVTCSATAISVYFVMTAARCYQLIIDDKKKRDDTKLEVNLTRSYGHTLVDLHGFGRKGGFSQTRTGIELIVHSSYLHVSTMFDVNIALVRVNSKWNIYNPAFSLPVMAEPLPPDGFLPCFGVGIGRTHVNNEKKKVNWFKVSVGGYKYCKYLQKEYNKREVHFDKFYMCAKTLSKNQDICMGDVGGALICDGLFAGVMSQRVQDYECQVGGKQFSLYTSPGADVVMNWTRWYIPYIPQPLEITIPDPWDYT